MHVNKRTKTPYWAWISFLSSSSLTYWWRLSGGGSTSGLYRDGIVNPQFNIWTLTDWLFPWRLQSTYFCKLKASQNMYCGVWSLTVIAHFMQTVHLVAQDDLFDVFYMKEIYLFFNSWWTMSCLYLWIFTKECPDLLLQCWIHSATTRKFIIYLFIFLGSDSVCDRLCVHGALNCNSAAAGRWAFCTYQSNCVVHVNLSLKNR